ncbi:MAG: phosphoribosylformylglycinamidine cyclo-ligase [Solirubrobacterales bacterium]|nr:phosphoribosylformylglycinamidine cyclo-ligase [Solirubrobacterales bacterium]
MSGDGESAYAAAGVDYSTLDAGKRLALTEALASSAALAAHGGRALDVSRGEPAFVFEFDGRAFAFVMEGLGTKAVASRQVAEQLGINRFDAVAVDTVAAIVNDLCCVGALPLVVNAYFATGSSDWYRNAEWHQALVRGWSEACATAGATWGGGESPSLPGLVAAEDIELAGSAVGALPAGRAPILGQDLAPGDEIVMVASSGLHANGASLARMVAERLPGGWATPLPSGRAYGDALLDPSIVYAPLVAALADADVPVSYYSHVTGHGLLKLMRPDRRLTYRITALPEVPEVLAFLAEQAGMDAHQAYSTLNMGSGYAVYAPAGTGTRIVEIARGLGLDALVAGAVEEGPRQVVVEPVGVVYADSELDLTPDR